MLSDTKKKVNTKKKLKRFFLCMWSSQKKLLSKCSQCGNRGINFTKLLWFVRNSSVHILPTCKRCFLTTFALSSHVKRPLFITIVFEFTDHSGIYHLDTFEIKRISQMRLFIQHFSITNNIKRFGISFSRSPNISISKRAIRWFRSLRLFYDSFQNAYPDLYQIKHKK